MIGISKWMGAMALTGLATAAMATTTTFDFSGALMDSAGQNVGLFSGDLIFDATTGAESSASKLTVTDTGPCPCFGGTYSPILSQFTLKSITAAYGLSLGGFYANLQFNSPILGSTPPTMVRIGISESLGSPPVAVGSSSVTAPTAAPEINPASWVSSLTLLLGALAVLRGGRPQRLTD